MPANTRVIKRRITSVKNTRKITKAMEMVAASKMRRSVNAVVATRPFTTLAWETVRAVAKVTDPSHHPLLAPPEDVKNVLIILYTSDRGLCGGYNSKMVKTVLKKLEQLNDVNVEICSVGARGGRAIQRAGREVVASFTDITNNPTFQDIRPITKLALDGYVNGKYDTVLLAYTDFVSAVIQHPTVVNLLPLAIDSSEALGTVTKEPQTTEHETASANEYVFEPSPKAVLDNILPRIVETMVWQALLEASASEHSARMMAMRSASDAAGDMIESLTFTFNQARQASITQEIAEISSGKAALEA